MSSTPFQSNQPIFTADEDDDSGLGNGMRAAMMSKFLEARTVMLFGGVDQKLAERISMQLLYLDHLSNEPIKLMINSPGGHVESGDTIHDLIHQPSGGAGGKASDIAIQAEEIVKMRERIARKIAEATGTDYEKVVRDIDRDFWMNTEEAKEYGILGNVISHASEVKI